MNMRRGTPRLRMCGLLNAATAVRQVRRYPGRFPLMARFPSVMELLSFGQHLCWEIEPPYNFLVLIQTADGLEKGVHLDVDQAAIFQSISGLQPLNGKVWLSPLCIKLCILIRLCVAKRFLHLLEDSCRLRFSIQLKVSDCHTGLTTRGVQREGISCDRCRCIAGAYVIRADSSRGSGRAGHLQCAGRPNSQW